MVPNQDPQKIGDLFEAYVKKVTPKTSSSKSRACTAASRG